MISGDRAVKLNKTTKKMMVSRGFESTVKMHILWVFGRKGDIAHQYYK